MYKYFFKRLFDFLIALIAMPFVLIVICISAICIKIEDKGPVFYKAQRIGRKGKIFSMLKLRSMKVNAPDIRLEDGSTYNAEDDPRVTKFGKFARRTSIDEIPQLINVLLGQMALIGPRPDPPDDLDRYTEEERVILKVRPGITGYNQAINRNSVTSKEKLKNDIYYVNRLSFLLDIKIVFLTIKAVFSHKNVYRNDSDQNADNLKKKTIMILGASILQLPAIVKAKEMGLNVVVVDMNPAAIGFKEDGIVKEVISTIDKQAVLEAAIRNHIDGIMTLASDMPMQTVAYVAKNMGLNGISEDTALKATNKAHMREALKENGVPIPLFFRVKDKAEFNSAINAIKNNFIVKPADNSGSRGVSLVKDLSDDKTIETAYDYAKKCSRSGEIVVEEYMKGPEVSVETLTVNGDCKVIQITDKKTTGAPHFVETGHSQPSKMCAEVKREIEKVAIAANKAIGIQGGPSHTEIIVTDKGPKVVELGARLGGDCINTHLVPLSTGVNMVECCIKIALGEEPDTEIKFNKGSAIRYFSQSKGVIKSIDGIETAKKSKGIQEVAVVHGVGETVTEICDSASRIGFVIAQDEDASSAIFDCENALKNIKIEIN